MKFSFMSSSVSILLRMGLHNYYKGVIDIIIHSYKAFLLNFALLCKLKLARKGSLAACI